MVYLDHAATTPMSESALSAYVSAARQAGNPSSLHKPGRRARRVVEEARERVAAALGARPGEVIFTGGGTESDNIAIKGIFWSQRAADPGKNVVITSAIEHHAVLHAVEWLRVHEDATVELLPVDAAGRVTPASLEEALRRHGDAVALVSVAWANNEVGTVQPVGEFAQLAAEAGVPFHTDAVQAVGQLPVDFAASCASALTLTAHKLGGPPGVGALLVRREIAVTPLVHGGGQERGVHSGTLNAPGIAAASVAVGEASANVETFAEQVGRLRDDLVERMAGVVPTAIRNGDVAYSLPGIAHFSFPGCEGDALLMLLDARGIACSTGSACTAGVPQPSHVLLAMGADPALARSSLRFSLGASSTKEDVDALIEAIGPVVKRASSAEAPPGVMERTFHNTKEA